MLPIEKATWVYKTLSKLLPIETATWVYRTLSKLLPIVLTTVFCLTSIVFDQCLKPKKLVLEYALDYCTSISTQCWNDDSDQLETLLGIVWKMWNSMERKLMRRTQFSRIFHLFGKIEIEKERKLYSGIYSIFFPSKFWRTPKVWCDEFVNYNYCKLQLCPFIIFAYN